MNASTIISLVVLFASYICFSQFYLKKHLGIKSKWMWMLSEERNKFAVMIDVVLLVLFVFSYLKLNIEPKSYKLPVIVRMSPMFLLFFLQNINQGFEEYFANRSEKSYYHHWLGSFVLLVTFIILLWGEQM